jgi:hypothetical protein
MAINRLRAKNKLTEAIQLPVLIANHNASARNSR